MKKLIASAMALFLLFSALPVWADELVVQVEVHGEKVTFADAQPFLQGDEVMIPVLFVFEQLGDEVIWNEESRDVLINRGELQILFSPGEAIAYVNGTGISYAPASFIKQNRSYVPMSFFNALTDLKATYDPHLNIVQISTDSASASISEDVMEIIELMETGQFQTLIDQYFEDTMKAQIDAPALEQVWLSVTGEGEKHQSIILQNDTQDGPYHVIVVGLEYEEYGFDLTIAYDGQDKIAGLFLSGVYSTVELPLPVGVIEEDIIVGEGTEYPLNGTLTLPADPSNPVAAVVLVQGSGPSDRDETVAAYKPFRDLAWGLAQQGIASIRYDKRTYAHVIKLAQQNLAEFTVKEEFVEDAVLAANLLKSDARIDSDQVYLIGHSQGGMLAPRIDAEGGDFAGLVILAGTPRTLWEVIHDQNMAVIAEMETDEAAQYLQLVEAEMEKARKLQDMSDEEAMATTVFGMPAYYFKEMDQHSARIFAANSDKPMLILQGEDDFQVYADIDFVAWQELLQHHDKVEYKLYPGLNHFFIEYEGEAKGTIAEYNEPGHVDEEVIRDIALWIGQLAD